MSLDRYASQYDKSPSTPVGSKDFELKVVDGTNKSTYINGREYSGHALDRMQGRGLYPSVVEDAIHNGTMSFGKTPGTYTFNTRTITGVTNENGKVITVWQK